jgi:TonB family protein
MHHMNVLANLIQRCKTWRVLPLLMVLLALLEPSFVRAQQQPELDALASEMATAIFRSYKSVLVSTKVLVIDFAGANEAPTELGEKLADAFSDSLSKNARGFVVMDRAEYMRSFAADQLAPDSYENPATMKCYADGLKATVVVEGDMDVVSDKVVLWVKALRIQDKKAIFDKRISLSLTPEMQTQLSHAVPSPAAVSSDTNTWVNPTDLSLGGDTTATIPDDSRHGYNPPTCLYCPSPQFSGAASKAKIQGTVLLSVVINKEGLPASVKVIRGLPCGLNRQAIDTLKQWKFKPATDRDGNPVAIRQSVEMSFHLY